MSDGMILRWNNESPTWSIKWINSEKYKPCDGQSCIISNGQTIWIAEYKNNQFIYQGHIFSKNMTIHALYWFPMPEWPEDE